MGKRTPPKGPPKGVVRAGIVSVVGHAPVCVTLTVNAPPSTTPPRVGGTDAQLSGDLTPTHNPSGSWVVMNVPSSVLVAGVQLLSGPRKRELELTGEPHP